MLLKKSTLILFLIPLCLFGQKTDSSNYAYTHASPIYLAVKYSRVLHGKIMPTNGIHTSLGLNIAALFKKNFTLGLVLDVRLAGFLGSNRKYKYLTKDVNENIILNQNNPYDSSIADVVYNGFNDKNSYSFGETYYNSYGFMFSPFPKKYGGIMLQIKKGTYSYKIWDVYKHPYIHEGKQENILLDLKIKYSIQLTCKPFKLFKPYNAQSNGTVMRNNFLLSFFYERINLRDAKLDNQPLNRYLKSNFFDKYPFDKHFGIKLSLGIY